MIMQTDLFIPYMSDEENEREVDLLKSLRLKNKLLAKRTNDFIHYPEPLRSKRIEELRPNSYGTAWQKIVRVENGWSDSNGKDGDGLNIHDVPFEVKASYLSENNGFNFVQIRPWQHLVYILKAIDPTENYKHYDFFLSKESMDEELKTSVAAPAHGTKKQAESNPTPLWALRPIKGSDHWKRWIDNYLTPNIKETIDAIKI